MKSSYIYSKQILSFVKIIINFTRVNSFGKVFYKFIMVVNYYFENIDAK